MFRRLCLLAVAIAPLIASAGEYFPCRTRSRQMTLIKNCFTGDMGKSTDGSQFIESAPPTKDGISYCYNSYVQVEPHKSNDPQVHFQIMRDGKDHNFHAYNFQMPWDDIKKLRKDSAYIDFKSVKGRCYATKEENRQACRGGFLKSLGLEDTDMPMVLAVTKWNNSVYVQKLVSSPQEIEKRKPKELEPKTESDATQVTQRLVQEVKKRLSAMARLKMALLHTGHMTPKKMSDSSEQFRYCSLAFDSFVRLQKMNDPFSTEERMAMNALTNYMNGDAAAIPTRATASYGRPRRR